MENKELELAFELAVKALRFEFGQAEIEFICDACKTAKYPRDWVTETKEYFLSKAREVVND